MSIENFREEVRNKQRFQFGKNWGNFLNTLSDARIKEAEESLKKMLEVESLSGKTFLDIGSGSGLFSLAARNLGACVTSFDFDEDSVRCTQGLKTRFYGGDEQWSISHGSVLDSSFLATLTEYDFVYSWGVLHHTGNMYAALDNATRLVGNGGMLFIAIYNSQPFATRYWTNVKKAYNRFAFVRPVLVLLHLFYPTLPSIVINLTKRKKPPRGMTIWYDLLDWLGGYPFEVSSPSEIFNFHKIRGFELFQIKTVGGRTGCNEYVFRRVS